MLYFLEGSFKKGINTVLTFIYHVICKKFALKYYNKIHLFSDAAGGQNKSYVTMTAVIMQVEITHLYFVRGHSMCQCDRNFGLYTKKNKMLETIELEEEYVDLIRTSRDPPFLMVKAETELKMREFDQMLIPNGAVKKVGIQKAVKIVYYCNGIVGVFLWL